jgi:VWFA-related protein
MPVSRPLPRAAALLVPLFIVASLPVLAQTPAGTPPQFGGETVNVEIQIVPFYATDSEGRPIYDLKPEEVELRVGGTPVPIETFDRYGMAARDQRAQKASPEPAPSRQVFFLFDLAFSNETGLNLSQRLAAELLDDWPGADRLTLLVHDTQKGFGPRFGPVLAGEGKAQMLAAIKDLKPEVRRLNQNTEADFPAVTGAGRMGGMVQMAHNYDSMRAGARSEYHGVARAFAQSLEALAFNLRRAPGPKLLLIFSQGVDPDLYFGGDTGNGVGSSETTRVDTRRAPPLVDRFKGPLAALADSGTLTLFVNGGKKDFEEDSAMRDMAKTTGGLYLEGVSPKILEGRITGSTAAYYEAGFHPTAALLQATRANVEVTVRRPGVRAWAPAAVRTREAYASLSAYEKRLLVLGLITGGPGSYLSRVPVRLDVQDLDGKLAEDPRRFEVAWPADLASRRIDLYTVAFAPPETGKGRILRYDPYEGVASSDHASLEIPMEDGTAFVWGIVAIDPQTERAWYRRLMVKPAG